MTLANTFTTTLQKISKKQKNQRKGSKFNTILQEGLTRKDSERFENALSDEDSTSESEEDINAHSTDSSMSDENDGYDEKK